MKQPTIHATHLDPAQYIVGTWAGGTTHQIYAYPPNLETIASAQFWLGTAVIQQAAPYSFFPERIRIHIPIQGNGIQLHFQHPSEVVALDTYGYCRFDGARPVRVELVDGPVVALNLIFRSDIIAEAQIVRFDQQRALLDLTVPILQENTLANRTLLQIVYVIAGSITLRIADDPAVTLHPNDTFIVHSHTLATYTPMMLKHWESQAEYIVVTAWFPEALM
jgi:environmental stress-induced protein Ves